MPRPITRAVLVAALLAGGAAHAQEATARQHYESGMAACAVEDWDRAVTEFEAGFRVEPNPAFLYRIARAHQEAKRPEQAVRFYKQYLEVAPPDAPDRAEVEQRLAALQRASEAKPSAPATPPTAKAPEKPLVEAPARPAPARRRDRVAIGLLAGGAALIAAGIGLVVYADNASGQASDPSTHADLTVREGLQRRSNATGIAGWSAIGVGVGVLLGGGFRLSHARPRRVAFEIGPVPGGALAGVGGSF